MIVINNTSKVLFITGIVVHTRTPYTGDTCFANRPVSQAKDKNKKHDLSKWTYAEIRDAINTSSGLYNITHSSS